MGLNIAKGNMYPFVTHTWNAIKGSCPHGCTYCYMRRFKNQRPVRFDEKELKTDLGEGNFIFVGSSCDMFAEAIPDYWIYKTLEKCEQYNNRYFFQSKNPKAFLDYLGNYKLNCLAGTTIESNRRYPEMGDAPFPDDRAKWLSIVTSDTFITIEPIMDFDLIPMVELIARCNPVQVNIGADSGNNHLPEPTAEKVRELIAELERFTTVVQKKNLARILGQL